MKFPYISVLPLLEETKSSLKTLNNQGLINLDDLYMHAADFVRLLPGDAYDDETVCIQIRNYNGALPKDFYLADEFWMCDEVNPCAWDACGWVPFAVNAHCFRKTQLLALGNSASRACCTPSCGNPHESPGSQNVQFLVPPGVMRASFKTGAVMLKYLRLLVDEQGIIMIPDEPNTIKGLKAYLRFMVLEEAFYAQQLPEYIYREAKLQYEEWTHVATQILKWPEPSQMKVDAVRASQRYRRFNIRLK